MRGWTLIGAKQHPLPPWARLAFLTSSEETPSVHDGVVYRIPKGSWNLHVMRNASDRNEEDKKLRIRNVKQRPHLRLDWPREHRVQRTGC